MQRFMDQDFLLSNETARSLYHDYSENMPIVDYHCHVSPREIYEDRKFANITEVWLGGDHYKWRLMRSNGIPEHYITGDASPREKFQKFAETLPKAIGNPMYHWCHLELKKYFGYTGILNGETAQEVWALAEARLAEPGMGARGLIAMSNVAFVGTTDDPVDSLEWHKKIAEDPSIATIVAPSFRPDKALNIDKAGWMDYIHLLSKTSGSPIFDMDSLCDSLSSRMEFFSSMGCKASDHGLDYMVYRPGTKEQADQVMQLALRGQPVTQEQAELFKTYLLVFCGARYSELGWVMQLHYNCLRNPNSRMLAQLGPDTGFDCIGPDNGAQAVAKLLDSLYSQDKLPKTILYSLDPGDNSFLDTIIGAFQGTECPGKLQHGSAWWFNDNKEGMRQQLISLANLSLLGNFVGMLTDSRSFLSYTRHEYFRRILCDLIGTWVENGEYPLDMATLGSMVQDISNKNAVKYFGIDS